MPLSLSSKSRPVAGLQSESTSRADEAFARALGVLGLIFGAIAAGVYAQADLTLSHYDARAHLVVARRVLDSLTPGWAQVGAVWLPLPHLLNLFPIQIDALYRTGASAVAISVAAFGIGCYAVSRLVLQVTRSRLGAAFAVACFALNPNVIYLASTPMTEPLLFGLILLSVSLTFNWIEQVPVASPRAAGLVLAAACLTRYEAWFVAAALVLLSAASLLRRGRPIAEARAAAWKLAVYPLAAMALFVVHSRVTTEQWFVTTGFFVPDNPATGSAVMALGQVAWGVSTMAGLVVTAIALVGLGRLLVGGLRDPERAPWLVELSLTALMALPLYAFYQGHPFRMRYLVGTVVASAVLAGIALGTVRGRLRAALALLVAADLAFVARPFDQSAPMVLEAQWDHANSIGRRTVTACLAREHRGELILISMGALAHYMHELSDEGFDVRDFLHEGNSPQWRRALETPVGRVGWILIEEQAEGGDLLMSRARQSPDFLAGFRRRCEGGGVALYEAIMRENTLRRR